MINKSWFSVRLSFLAIGIYLLFALFVDLRVALYGSTAFAYFTLIFSLVLLYSSIKLNKLKLSGIEVVWLISLVFVVRGGLTNDFVLYFISILFLVGAKHFSGNYWSYIQLVAGLCSIHSFMTILFAYMPELYVVGIVPLFSEDLQKIGLDMIRTYRLPGLSAHYSTNGMYIALGVATSFSLFINRLNPKINFFLLLIALIGLFMIGKRAHLGFSVFAIIVFLWHNYSDSKNKRFWVMGILLLSIAGLSMLFIIFFPSLSGTLIRMQDSLTSDDITTSRTIFWLFAFSSFLENPIFGIGWRRIMGVMEHDVHNVYLQLLVETGFVGFAFFMFLFLYGIRVGVRNYLLIKKMGVEKHTGLKASLTFSIVFQYFFLFYCFTGNPLYDEQTLFPYFLSYSIVIYSSFFLRKFNDEKILSRDSNIS